MNTMDNRDTSGFVHKPVMLGEVLEGLDIKPDGIYLDGTAGGAGHSSAIAERLGEKGLLIAVDRDPEAIAAATERLSRFGKRAVVVRSNFSEMRRVCADLNVDHLDGVLLDLGVSSHQLDTPERGFSYLFDAPLSMKMDETAAFGAYEVVNGYDKDELCRILWDYGEEKFAARIADGIIRARQTKLIETTGELVGLIREALPDGGKGQNHHPAMRTFQAIRIEVNGELAVIPPALRDACGLLAPGGRVAVITFHSLEDRAVKETFAELSRGCTCPRDFPVCVCGKKPQIKLVNKKPILPGAAENAENSRAHSAKLRVAEKLPQ